MGGRSSPSKAIAAAPRTTADQAYAGLSVFRPFASTNSLILLYTYGDSEKPPTKKTYLRLTPSAFRACSIWPSISLHVCRIGNSNMSVMSPDVIRISPSEIPRAVSSSMALRGAGSLRKFVSLPENPVLTSNVNLESSSPIWTIVKFAVCPHCGNQQS
jgi:hypothetical protein